jgi:hypothetical protein
MPELVCELIISLDGFARCERSPAYYGYSGPDFDDWIETNEAVPHRMLIGRRTYEMLNGLPAAVGLFTLRLVRVAIGQVQLGDLGVGKWRDLTPAERNLLK